MGFLPGAVMLNMSQLHTQNEDNNEGTPRNGTISVLMKELLPPETQLSTRTLQSCKARVQWNSKMGCTCTECSWTRLLPKSWQRGTTSFQVLGKPQAPRVQDEAAWTLHQPRAVQHEPGHGSVPAPRLSARSRGRPGPTHPRSCRRCCSERRGAAGRSYRCSST